MYIDDKNLASHPNSWINPKFKLSNNIALHNGMLES